MAEGKLIIETYEYQAQNGEIPRFAYIPCPLAECMGRSNTATIREIVDRGFNLIAKKDQNPESMQVFLTRLDVSGFGGISVQFYPGDRGLDPYVKLTNVTPVYLGGNVVGKGRRQDGGIILHGRYRLSDGHETTALKDAQRVTLIYDTTADNDWTINGGFGESVTPREICLNITYLER